MSKQQHAAFIWMMIAAICICMLLGEFEGAKWLVQTAVLLDILHYVKKG